MASVSGFLAVALGAFGAHALKDSLTQQYLDIYHTAVNYQFTHTLALLAVATIMISVGGSVYLKVAGMCFSIGILIFSGSLYVLVFTSKHWLGAITPIGGSLLLVGWASLFLYAITYSKTIGQ